MVVDPHVSPFLYLMPITILLICHFFQNILHLTQGFFSVPLGGGMRVPPAPPRRSVADKRTHRPRVTLSPSRASQPGLPSTDNNAPHNSFALAVPLTYWSRTLVAILGHRPRYSGGEQIILQRYAICLSAPHKHPLNAFGFTYSR